jgi:cullin-associated NEDD8-dissociated protein 1
MGRLVAVLGGSLKAHMLSECLPMLLDRLRNEITRLAAVKAFATISAGVGASGKP